MAIFMMEDGNILVSAPDLPRFHTFAAWFDGKQGGNGHTDALCPTRKGQDCQSGPCLWERKCGADQEQQNGKHSRFATGR